MGRQGVQRLTTQLSRSNAPTLAIATFARSDRREAVAVRLVRAAARGRMPSLRVSVGQVVSGDLSDEARCHTQKVARPIKRSDAPTLRCSPSVARIVGIVAQLATNQATLALPCVMHAYSLIRPSSEIAPFSADTVSACTSARSRSDQEPPPRCSRCTCVHECAQNPRARSHAQRLGLQPAHDAASCARCTAIHVRSMSRAIGTHLALLRRVAASVSAYSSTCVRRRSISAASAAWRRHHSTRRAGSAS